MKNFQKLLFVAFIISNTVRTAINCFALNQLIKILGADQLGPYYGYSSLISIGAILLLTFLSRKVSPTFRFFSLHLLFIGIALLCLLLSSEVLQAKLVFLSLMGLGIIIYFNNWSLAASFISPFESKRLFPLLGIATQIGIFAGALVAMAAHFGLSPKNYFTIWLLGEILVLVMAIPLFISSKKARGSEIEPGPESSLNLLQLVRHYQLVPRLTLWVFLWGLLFYSISSLAGESFDRSGLNLTMFYGILTLACAVLSIFISSMVYPKIVRWVGLGSVLLAVSIIALLSGGFYLAFNYFGVAIAAMVIFEMLDGGFVTSALSVEFGLYPTSHRDRLRLLAEILAMSAGTACVALLFSVPAPFLRWLLAILFLVFAVVGFFCRKTFVGEVLKFLNSKDPEELNNAIALFDMLKSKEGYHKIMAALLQDGELSTRINILNTFANLGTLQPLAPILKLFEETNLEPLRIAILRYIEHIRFKELDPFLQYQLLESLKLTCRSKASNILRSMAIKILIQNGSPAITVAFIVEALKDKEDRIVANAIEGLHHIEYAGVVTLLKPFLKNSIPRIRANCIITLWKYAEVKDEVIQSLDEMLQSNETGQMISGLFALGEVKDSSRMNYLKEKLFSDKKEILRGALIALLKLGDEEVYPKAVEIILGSDEAQAINLCYLSLRLDERILNELIIADICQLSSAEKELAYQRYSRCGAFCRDQLNLLAGRKSSLSFLVAPS